MSKRAQAIRFAAPALHDGGNPSTTPGVVVVFTLFHMKIFSKMVGKHSNRIAAYEDDKIGFWRFFDASGYIMMAIMMSGGISLRAFGLIPMWFIVFFYTGLGIALALSGVSFLVRFAAAAAPLHRVPLASLRSRARRNRARLRAKPTRQASRIPPHIASKARSHPKQRPLQDADWMGTDDIIACPDPNCEARFKITRVGTRTFRPRTRRPSRRSSTDTRAFRATATHSSARAHDTRASST